MNKTHSASKSQTGINGIVAAWIAQIRLGTPLTHRDITVWPLFAPGEQLPEFRTLDETVGSGLTQVTEISDQASVPQLKVINHSPDPVLILDGEELVGAKQNRAANTTMLVAGKSETIIPVSCTEHGRWHHVSKAFNSSDVVMEMKLRRSKVRAVSDSLKRGEGHSSHQEEIWSGIAALHAKAAHVSPTQALHDLFLARETETRAALEAFPVQEGQHGLLVSIRGRVVGCDVLSRQEAYRRLHGKLIRSYILDSLLEPPGQPGTDTEAASSFLAGVSSCKEEQFPAIGLGASLRLQNGRTAGAALVHEGVVIHAALFRFDTAEESQTGAGSMESHFRRHQRFFGGARE